MTAWLDDWTVRSWLFWLPCLLRGHPDTFWLEQRWVIGQGEPVTIGHIVRCSCGRRIRKEPSPTARPLA